MCGIVGYLGKKSPVPLIVDSLRTLEYRGYDSAGVAYLEDDRSLQIYKASGKLINLENLLPASAMSQNGNNLHIGIGHIRWATHGAPTDENAHPHLGADQQVAVVHNGIIENFAELKQELVAKGYVFQSETDTECVAHLLEEAAKAEPDFLKALCKVLGQLRGAYALTVIHRNHPDKLYAVRNHAPLIIGVGEGEYMVASDTVAVVNTTNRVIFLKDHQIAEVSPQGVRIFLEDGTPIEPVVELIQTGPLQIDKKGFKHFMMKEIHEQPDVIRNSLFDRLTAVTEPIHLFPLEAVEQARAILKNTRRLMIVGCGSSLNAGLVGKYFIEDLVRLPVEVEAAGEYRYRNPVLDEHTLVIAISQSGETADTLEAVRQSQHAGAKALIITNRVDSTMAREADFILPVYAGVEVSVCATKSFLAQVMVLYLLGLYLAELHGNVAPEQIELIKSELIKIPTLIEAILSQPEPIQALAKKYGSARDILFIARGVNYPVAMEGALKLKEISYIHAEAYSGSELKHGPIAMLDENIPVVSVLAPGLVLEKMISNCQEAKARDARVIAVTSAELTPGQAETFEDILPIPRTLELLSPLVTTIPLQLLAYYMAEHLGKDVDQPRNLAKSVTVE